MTQQRGFYPGIEQIYQSRSMAAADAAFGPVTEQDFVGQWKVYDSEYRYGGDFCHYIHDCATAEDAVAKYCTDNAYEDVHVRAGTRRPENCRAEKFGNWV